MKLIKKGIIADKKRWKRIVGKKNVEEVIKSIEEKVKLMKSHWGEMKTNFQLWGNRIQHVKMR